MINNRANFAQIKARYNEQGKGSIRLTQSTLFLTQPIQANVATYNFKVLETDTVGLQTDEIRLNQNDEFIVTHVGIYLIGRRTDEMGAPQQGNFIFTHAPINMYAAFYAQTRFWDGYMKMTINNIVYVDKYDIRKHERTQWSQWESHVAGAAAFQTLNATLPSTDAEIDGVHEVTPMVTLSGAKKNEIQYILPEAIAPETLTYTGNDNLANNILVYKVGLHLRGYLGQNGAVFQGPSNK